MKKGERENEQRDEVEAKTNDIWSKTKPFLQPYDGMHTHLLNRLQYSFSAHNHHDNRQTYCFKFVWILNTIGLVS